MVALDEENMVGNFFLFVPFHCVFSIFLLTLSCHVCTGQWTGPRMKAGLPNPIPAVLVCGEKHKYQRWHIDWAFFTYYYNFIFFMKYCIIFVCRKNIYIFYYILLFRYLFRILNDCKVWVLYNYTDMDSCSPAAKSWKMRIYQTNTSIKKDALFKNPTEHCKTLQ